MNAILHLLPALWAQRNSELVEHLRPRSTTDLNSLLTALVLILAVIGIVMLTSRFVSVSERRRNSSPRRLFQELCRAHELSWNERQLLKRLAAWHGLKQPAALFVEPERFLVDDPALEPYRGALVELHARLF